MPDLSTHLTAPTHLYTRRRFLTASAGLLAVAAYAGTHGRHELEVVPRTVRIRNLPDAFLNFRFVQISDIHLTEYTEPWYLQRVIDRINALAPELVLLTGDFVSRGPQSWPHAWRAAGVVAEMLTQLRAPQRFAILGNHDAGVGPSHVIDPLQAHGTPFLVNQHVAIERGSDRIWLCGLENYGLNPDINLTVPADPRAPVIVMGHEPDFADTVAAHPRAPLIDLMLSGHSHGGQVRLPLLGPLILPPLGKKYVHGAYQFGGMQLYVNRGIGSVGMPFRLNCPSEITDFTLVRA